MRVTKADRPAKLVFNAVLVIVGGGDVDLALLAQLHAEGAAVIAADGGAHTCRRAGIMPQAIIGDMDSLDRDAIWPADTQIVALDEQETTDFEKCLYMTQAPVTLALGMSGGRLDHTLASLDVLARHATARQIIFVDDSDIALGLSGSFDLEIEVGERVSVHPLTRVQFERSKGLLYPLDGLILAPGARTSTSNTATASQVQLRVAAGDTGVYLLIVARNHLNTMIAQAQS